jgi:RHS repeat-associated protein
LTQTIGTVDNRIYSYDANGNVTSFTGNAASASYGYDGLDRLTQDTSSLSTSSFTYDANGNRLSSAGPWMYSYVPQSNRLQKWGSLNVVLDEAGNFRRTFQACLVCRPMPDAPYISFNYSNAGRLSEIRREGWNPTTLNAYTYNAQGLRTRKVTLLFRKVPTHETTVYHYDLNGNIIAETREDGSLRRAYVWADDRPLVQIDAGSADTVSYLHADHLNTPRLATNAAATVVWHWEGAAFGNTAPQEDPDGDGVKTTFNLRFPGQYYDVETGFFYNWHRYYSPGLGRYITSDPIGRLGGLNTYSYALNNPLQRIDSDGLQTLQSPLVPDTPQDPGPPDSAADDPKDPECKQKCFRREFKKCLIGGGISCGAICSAATTTLVGGLVCAVGCPCNLAYACYQATELFCTGRCDR